MFMRSESFFSRLATVLLSCGLSASMAPREAFASLPKAQSPMSVVSQAAVTVPSNSEFVPFRCKGDSASDPLDDALTGKAERDMVGNDTHPAFYRAADDTHLFFRLRLNGDPRKPKLSDLSESSYDILFDTDGDYRTYELMLTADGNLQGSTKIQLVRNSEKNANDPTDSAKDKPDDLLKDFTPATDYYSVEKAWDNSSFSFDPDYFITLAVPRSALAAAGLNTANKIVVWGGTNSRNYSLNSDFGCYANMPTNLEDAAPDPVILDPNAPNPQDDSVTVNEDTSVTTDVLANDREPGLSLTRTTPARHGTVTVNAHNTVTYTPHADYHGEDSYTYEVRNARGKLASATVKVVVRSVNDAPRAGNDQATGIANSSGITIRVLTNDVDVDGDALTVTSVTQGAHGTVSVNAEGVVTYVPTSGLPGTDTFHYTVSDGQGMSGVGEVTVQLLPVPDTDADDDGLSDADEEANGLDPHDADTDDDGVADGGERDWSADTDGDGLPNAADPDSDNDGLFDGLEQGVTTPGPGTNVDAGHFVADADPTTTTDPLVKDTDGGGIGDGTEDTNHNGRVDEGERDPRVASDDQTELFGLVGGGCSAAGGSLSPLLGLALVALTCRRRSSRRQA